MTKAQFAVVVALLSDIKDALVGPESEPVEGCQHERKVSFATPGDPLHWICPDCKAQSSTREYREARAKGPIRASGPIAPGGQADGKATV
jgi:hypothetical protein